MNSLRRFRLYLVKGYMDVRIWAIKRRKKKAYTEDNYLVNCLIKLLFGIRSRSNGKTQTFCCCFLL